MKTIEADGSRPGFYEGTEFAGPSGFVNRR